MMAILWLAVAVAILVTAELLLVHPWHIRWGATKFDTRRPMPGDELLPQPLLSATRALTIGAPADRVWPLLLERVQAVAMACERTGKGQTALRPGDSDHPPAPGAALQVGDALRLDPLGLRPPLNVDQIDPGRHLVLSHPPTSSWCIGLYPVASRSTRLVVRTRTHRSNWISRPLDAAIAEPRAFLVARQILVGTRDLAESPPLPTSQAELQNAPEAKSTV